MTTISVLIVGEDDLIAWAIRKRFSAMKIPSRLVATPEEALAEIRKGLHGIVVFDPGLLETAGPGGIEKYGLQECPEAELRVFEKPLTIFDLDRVVEKVAGRFSEKRGNPRHACNVPLRISLLEEEQDREDPARGHSTGVAAEASENGLRVFTAYPLVPGQRLLLNPLAAHYPLAGFIRRDRVAEVVWVVADEEGVIAGLRYGE